MDNNYAEMILDALDDPSPTHSANRVKAAVATELAALDSTANVSNTGFFNHTFAPDFVLSWDDKTERQVFLRSTYDASYLAEDVADLTSGSAMIFGLPSPLRREFPELEDALSGSDAMFTGPTAIEGLIELKDDSGAARMLNNALAQGGRGLVTESTAIDLAETVTKGFSAAAALDPDTTGEAARRIDQSLGEKQAWRLTRVLQAVWEGSDGNLADFPGAPDLSGKLNDSSLQYLVEYMESEDLDFWRRVGRSVTLAQLAKLKIGAHGGTFNRLVNANLDVIRAGSAVLIPDALSVEAIDRLETFSWAVRESRVSLEGPKFFVMVGDVKADVSNYVQGTRVGLSATDVIKRSPDLTLSEITFESGREGLTYSSQDGELNKDRLLGIAGQWVKAPLAQTAIANSSSGRVNIAFAEGLAWRTSNSNVLLADLLDVSVPLLHELETAESLELTAFLEYKRETSDPTAIELFEERAVVEGGRAIGDTPVDAARSETEI